MKSLVSVTAAVAAGVALAVEMPKVQVVSFSTEGPDKYEDGSVVSDGECYALVWSEDGVFEGIDAAGKAKGEGDKVVYIGAFAKGGKCPYVMCKLEEGVCDGGFFDIWLLDTRVFDNGKVVSVGKKGDAVTVTHAVKASASSVSVGAADGGSAPQSMAGVQGGALAGQPTVDPATVPPPRITGLAFDCDGEGRKVVVLDVAGTVPGVNYGVAAGANPAQLGEAGGKTSGNGGTVKIVAPATGDSGFYRGVVK